MKWLNELDQKKFGHWTVEDLQNVKRLDLSGKYISNEDIQHLGMLTSLTGLNLTSLKDLKLHDTNLSDKGLEHLTSLKTLNELNLGRTKISNKGLKKLKALTL